MKKRSINLRKTPRVLGIILVCCTAHLARVPIWMVLEGLAKSAGILGKLPPFQKPDLGSQLVRKGGGCLDQGHRENLRSDWKPPIGANLLAAYTPFLANFAVCAAKCG